MDQIWIDMYNAAKAVLGGVTISDYVTAGEVSAAVRSKSGKIYVGVCIDTCSTLGICAERNAIFNMITNGEYEMNLHPHAVRSASRSPDPMEMVSLAAVPLASFKPPFERRLAVRTRAVHKPSIRRLFAFGIPFRVFIPQPGSGSMSGMSLLPDARETGSHLYLPMHPEWPCAECSPLRCSPR